MQGKISKLKETERTSKGLRNMLFEQLDALRNGKINHAQARAVSSLASQILNTVRIEINVHRFSAKAQESKESNVLIPEIKF